MCAPETDTEVPTADDVPRVLLRLARSEMEEEGQVSWHLAEAVLSCVKSVLAEENVRAGRPQGNLFRRLLSRPDEVTRSPRSRHDHAARRWRSHRSRARVPPGSLQTQAYGSTTQNIYRTGRCRLRRPHRFLTRRATFMEMFRRSLPNGHARNRLLRLSKRLFKILPEIRKLRTT